ncbi:hypothetical protein Q5O24_02970 [Eubacteriaceae bacterium ES3]|nr:hypothetical protein Q5O24_02970 [Eubacteriaceae bacterium ES3]
MHKEMNLLTDYEIRQHNINENSSFEIAYVDPENLFLPGRIDIAAKLAFIEAYETGIGISEAEELYKKHIEAFTNGNFYEYGSKEKNSYEKFKESFINTIESIKNDGFKEDVSIIPVGAANVAFNGAHRIACAIYFKKKIKIIIFPHVKRNYDFQFFRKQLLEEKYILQMIRIFCRYKSDVFLTLIWPKGYSNKKIVLDELEQRHGMIVYKNQFTTNFETYEEFIHKIYADEEWIGSEKDNYIGVTKKALSSFETHGNIIGILVWGMDIGTSSEFKEIVRMKMGQKKRTLHTTDSLEETKEVFSLFFEFGDSVGGIKSGNMLLLKKKIRFIISCLIIKIKKIVGLPC